MEYQIIETLQGDAVVTFSANPIADRLVVSGTPKENPNGWVEWYNDASRNSYPDAIIRAITANNINMGILDTKRDFTIGNGILPYTEVIKKGKKEKVPIDLETIPDIKSFLSSYNEECARSCKDLLWLGNFFLKFNYLKGKKIGSLVHMDASYCRSGIQSAKKGRVEYMYYSPDWTNPKWDSSNPNNEDNNVARYTAYNALDTRANYPVSVWHGKDYMPGYPYYPIPAWHGALNWIRLANEVPLWHLSGIRNGYNIRWHIEVPMSYFESFSPEKRANAKNALIESMNQWLSGSQNVGKAFVSYVKQNGLDADKFVITPLKAELNDEAFTALFEQSNMAMTSAHSIHPSLAGVETQGKLSSGSELRNAYNFWIILKTARTRKLLLDPLYEVAKINGWDPTIKFGFENVELTTLDVNPTASQTVTT